jgi:hypothetical protein
LGPFHSGFEVLSTECGKWPIYKSGDF